MAGLKVAACCQMGLPKSVIRLGLGRMARMAATGRLSVNLCVVPTVDLKRRPSARSNGRWSQSITRTAKDYAAHACLSLQFMSLLLP